MTSNVPVKTIGAGELVKLRSNGQFAKLGLYIQRPATVYTMRVNQTFSSLDRVVELIYDGGSGTYTDAIAGMTVLVSGAGYGKHDKGICRLRKVLPSATTGTMAINETSDIAFAENDYITIVKSFSIWQKDMNIAGGEMLMDYDIAFGNYLNGGAIGRVGPIVAVIKLIAGMATFTPPSPALSACYDGATIVSYQYSAPGAVTISNMTSGTGAASWTYNAAGEYLWSCAITDSLGRVTTVYRWVIVEPTSEQFRLLSCTGDFDNGGWSFKVRSYSNMSDVYDRAMVTLYTAHESYGGVAGAIGKLAGYENILAVGWIDGATISLNTVEGYVDFEVKDASFWLSKIRSYPFGVDNSAVAPANWQEINELTVDKALAHLLFWNSTVTSLMDCFFTGSTTLLADAASPASNLWQQLTDIAFSKIFARPLINSLGQMFIEVDTQMLTASDQSALTIVQHLEKYDYQEGFEIKINKFNKTSMVDLSGSYFDGNALSFLYSKAPGSIGGTFGNPIVEENYSFDGQDQCNQQAGALYAVANNPYEWIDLELASQNRFFDITPRQFATINVSALNNPLGIVLTTAKLIPRGIELEYNEDGGFLKTLITFEFLAIASMDGVTYVPPLPIVENVSDDFILDDFGGVDFPNPDLGTWFPPYLPPPIGDPSVPCNNLSYNGFSAAWDKKEIRGDGIAPLTARLYFPCKLHAAGGVNKLSTVSGWLVGGDAVGKFSVYGISGGARVITASITGGKAVFSPVAQIDVDGFEIELQAGLGSLLTYTPSDYVASGSVAATNSAGVNVATVEGQYYSIEGIGGPWRYHSVYLQNGYNFNRGSGGSPSGGVGFTAESQVMSLEIPLGCLFTEAINGQYARTYFKGDPTNIFNFCVSDFLFNDNSGSLGYILRKAIVTGRRLILSSAFIQNVCPAG